MDERELGWRQWCLQLLIVLIVAGFTIPLVLTTSGRLR
jgi:hypothetical protein